MIEVGKYHTLTIVKSVDFGLYLDGGESGEILLPKRYIPEGVEVGDTIEVFLYLDSEGRPIATNLKPYIIVGEFAYLKVSHVDANGAFLDWGLMKDLFVPFKEQKVPMIVGESYVVYAYIDKVTERVVASSKVDKFLENSDVPFKEGDEVSILVYQRTDLGYKAIINGKYSGLLYNNEIHKPLKVGDSGVAYVKQIRPDFKIDLILRKPQSENVGDVTGLILQKLKESSGLLPIGDKSSPEEIYQLFGVSKKVFKKAVGDLYKKRIIGIEENGIRLV